MPWNICYRCAEGVKIVVLSKYRSETVELAHSLTMSGYLRVNTTQDRILQHFYRPKLSENCLWKLVMCVRWLVKQIRMSNQPHWNLYQHLMKHLAEWLLIVLSQCQRENLVIVDNRVCIHKVSGSHCLRKYHPRSLSRLWPNFSHTLVCPKKFNLIKVSISYLGYFNK